MRNPPDRYSSPDPSSDNNARRGNQGGRRARTIRDMFVEQPLRRLTSGQGFRRRADGTPGTPRGGRRNNPPDLYDLDANSDARPSTRMRWTEPGTWMRDRQAGPDQTDTRRPNRDMNPNANPNANRGPERGPASGPLRGPRSGSLADRPRPDMERGAPSEEAPAATGLRWKRPDWLGKPPAPGEIPPVDPAPPTTPRYGAGVSPAPTYQPPEEYDPDRERTNYRATSVRAALWSSRTPSYEPDQPPAPAQQNTTGELAYLESYNQEATPASLAHSYMAQGQSGTYVPGATSEVEQLRQQARGRTAGPAPYFWDMVKKPKPASPVGVFAFWLVSLLVIGSALLTSSYAGVSIYAASKLIYSPQVAPKGTPADDGLAYKDVVFTSRTDHLLLRGWFIPGVVSKGHLTTRQTIIIVHGIHGNRADPSVGLLDLSAALAKHGFAVLTFDLRGSGDSTSAPTSLGYFEQRDVLGAVDFLQSGTMPYPDLGRPKAIGGLGVSMGAASLLMAAAQEPALRAIVSDSAFADIMPILQREIPAQGHVPSAFTPGILEAAQVMYGVDFAADRPEAVVARIAPRPILFIHGTADTYISPDNMTALAQAAQQGKGAHVQTWLVPNAKHARAFKIAGQAYIDRVVSFFAANLTPAAA
ncbi:MAG TPA: alpha/beta fold hydrolase [Ktedonobacterales bacterium]|nr:alpha/beta fold hydrolase [Ktedonobacterales bacterium]